MPPRKPLKHVILLDKPDSLTSMQCVERAKALLGCSKAGHSGTLDPKVTGLMLICLDEAVKAMPLFLGLDKEYEGILTLHSDVPEEDLRKAASGFVGRITQRPPVRSAVARVERQRTVHSFQLMGRCGRDALFRVRCEAGTYIRKICSDLGDALGTGAHMAMLRRTAIDGFRVREAVGMEAFGKEPQKYLIPLESALERAGLAKVIIRPESLPKVRNGLPIRMQDMDRADRGIAPGQKVGIYLDGSVVALGSAAKDYPDGQDLFRPERVFKE
jgi:H/ACA ribonucleoprotein complex subunit 4